MKRALTVLGAMGLGLSVVVAGCSPSRSTETTHPPVATAPVQKPQQPGGPHPPADGLTPATAVNLRPAFHVNLPGAHGSNESFPVEAGGLLYVTTGQAQVFALNAMTGQVVWSWQGDVPTSVPHINRGVAVGPTAVYVLTPGDELVALDRATGRALWRVRVADPSQGYFETMAPRYAAGDILVGSSGGDEGIRGFIAAFSADNGSLLWRFYTVPARGQGWMPATGDHGGGAVWTTPAYDPSTHTVYVGTGNPSPDYYGEARPGPDLYTDCVLAIDIQSGALKWYAQETAHDLWDYDVASPPIRFPVDGVPAVGEAGKNGYWYEWNAATGQPLIKPVAFVKEDHQPPTKQGVTEWPGPDGGANYGPSAYDAETHSALIAGINGPEVVYAGVTNHRNGETDFGTSQSPAPRGDWSGTVTSVNTTTGQINWQNRTSAPPIGGVTVSGGVALVGLANGTLEAIDARTGAVVWRTKTGVPIGSAPVVYTLQGQTYVAVVLGGSQSLASLYPWQGASQVAVWRLPASVTAAATATATANQ